MRNGLHAVRTDVRVFIYHREHEPRVPCMQHLVRLGVVDVVETTSRIVLEFISDTVDGLGTQQSRLEERDSRDASRDEALRLQDIKPMQSRVASRKFGVRVGTG